MSMEWKRGRASEIRIIRVAESIWSQVAKKWRPCPSSGYQGVADHCGYQSLALTRGSVRAFAFEQRAQLARAM